MRRAGNYAIVVLVALALTVLPGGGSALAVAQTLLTIAFFAAIVMLVAQSYRRYGFELDSLTDAQRLVLYGSVGAAILTFCATARLFEVGGAGVVVWLAVLGLCSYGLYWVWSQYRSYG